MVELVDTPALGAGAARREGSSPFPPTKHKQFRLQVSKLISVIKTVGIPFGIDHIGTPIDRVLASAIY